MLPMKMPLQLQLLQGRSAEPGLWCRRLQRAAAVAALQPGRIQGHPELIKQQLQISVEAFLIPADDAGADARRTAFGPPASPTLSWVSVPAGVETAGDLVVL